MPKWRFLVLDNGGATADRYTVFFKPNGWREWSEYFALSAYPDHPQGVSLYGEAKYPDFKVWLEDLQAQGDIRIKFSDLPLNVQKHVLARLSD